jgi:hypothetical protein
VLAALITKMAFYFRKRVILPQNPNKRKKTASPSSSAAPSHEEKSVDEAAVVLFELSLGLTGRCPDGQNSFFEDWLCRYQMVSVSLGFCGIVCMQYVLKCVLPFEMPGYCFARASSLATRIARRVLILFLIMCLTRAIPAANLAQVR